MPTPRRSLVALAVVLLLAFAALPAGADDGTGTETEPGDAAAAKKAAVTAETGAATAPAAPLAFGDDLDAALAEARESGRPLLVVATPDWYESPMWTQVAEKVLADATVAAPLAQFVRVRVRETRDREVHVRHRLPFAGYPLAIVLGADGTYLGHESGLPGDGDVTGWPRRLAAIPPRAERIVGLRKQLDAAPEDADVLFELGKLLAEAGEADRADALFERMERADPLAPAERLGEARYLRLRHSVIDLMEQKTFADVEGLCLRWRRRFETHARLADVLGLQAAARYLANRHDDAQALWKRIVADHPDTDAARRAQKALDGL